MYYIYHIVGTKIGCTNNIERRMKQQGFTEYEILEKYEDIDMASKRERELQKQYGYRIDGGYNLVINLDRSKGGRASATKQWSENRNELIERGKKCKPIMIERYGQTIQQFDLEGNFIKEWKGSKEAARTLNIKPPNLSACLNGRQKTSGGFIWKRV
jgi:hypothetical protein